MWGEQILTVESMNRMTFPRIAAYAEIGWVSPARKNYMEFLPAKLQLNMRGNFAEDNRPYTTTADIFDMLYKVPSGAMPIKTSNGRWGATSIYGSNPIAMISDTGY